jgi:hypothetical protein
MFDKMCGCVRFEPHDAQIEVFDAVFSKQRFVAPVFGRRAGKTVLGAMLDAYGTSQRNTTGWIVANTYEETQIAWEYLVQFLIDLWGENNLKINIQRMIVRTKWGATAQCKSADKPNSLVGRGLDWIHSDEAALWEKGSKIWHQMLRPALADKKGSAWFTTTPRGHNWFYDLLHTDKPNADKVWWKQYPTHVNPYIDAEELDTIKESLDPVTYKQEILAQFVSFAGMVYELFDTEKHILPVSRVNEITKYWERYILVDPGLANPTAMIDLAHNSMTGEDILVNEYQSSGMLFPDVLRKMNEMEPEQGWTGRVCDVAGKQRSQETNLSFVAWMREHNVQFQHGVSGITSGVNDVRSRLMSYDNKIRLWVSENCKGVIKAFLNYHYPESNNGEEPVKDNVNDHFMDALRYGVTHLHRRRTGTGRAA